MSRAVVFASSFALLCAPVLAQNWFHVPRTYDFAVDQNRLAGDLDGDGDVDLVVFDPGQSGYLWALARVKTNDGSGNFTSVAVYSIYGASADHAVLADVVGDARLDFVYSPPISPASPSPALFVMPGQAQGVPFGVPQFAAVPGLVKGLVAGDLDGDGDRDLLIAYAGAASVELMWLQNAAGTFTQLAPVVLPVGATVRALLAPDLDGDLRADAVVLTSTSMHALTTASNGALVGFGVRATSTQFFGYATTADCDGDLDDDVVVSGDFAPPVLLRNDGAGLWTSVPLPAAPGVAAGRVFAGDWDGDGDPDVTLRDLQSGFAQWRNDGSSGFTLAVVQSFGLDSSRAAVGLHDLDGDGAMDWVEARAVLFGDGTFRASEPALGAVGAQLRDVDGDGDLDRAIDHIGWQANDATGTFTLQTRVVPPPAPGRQWSTPVVAGDFDGDGFEEFVVAQSIQALPSAAFEQMQRLRDPGNGQLVDLGAAAPFASQMYPPALPGDFDQDGDLDVVTSDGLWRNNGAGFFAAPVPIAGFVEPLATGDVDGDGALDLVLGNGGGLPMQLAIQTPAGFVLSPLPGLGAGRPTLADLDDDGDLDLLFDSATVGTTVAIHANTGGGVFTSVLEAPWGSELGEIRLLAEDVDGDGRNDLVVSTSDRLHVLRRPGPGLTFENVRSYLAAGLATFGDVDLDGDRDAVGLSVVRASRVRGAGAGLVRQYGAATAGAGGARPVLGSASPAQSPGTVELRLRHGVGGALAILVVGAGSAPVPLPTFPGNTLQVGPVFEAVPLLLGGVPGVPAKGSFDLYVPIAAGLVGLQVFAQCVVDDPLGPSGLALSNALEVRFGP